MDGRRRTGRGRIRTIGPEILEDEKTAGLSDREWRIFVSMIALADDYGNLRGSPRWISAQALWVWGCPDIAAEIDHIEELGLVESYDVAGQSYLHITTRGEHHDDPATARRARRREQWRKAQARSRDKAKQRAAPR